MCPAKFHKTASKGSASRPHGLASGELPRGEGLEEAMVTGGGEDFQEMSELKLGVAISKDGLRKN